LDSLREDVKSARSSRDKGVERFEESGRENERLEAALLSIQQREDAITKEIEDEQEAAAKEEQDIGDDIEILEIELRAIIDSKIEVESKKTKCDKVLSVVLGLNQQLVETSASPSKSSSRGSKKNHLRSASTGGVVEQYIEDGVKGGAESAYKINLKAEATRLMDSNGRKEGLSLSAELKRAYDFLYDDNQFKSNHFAVDSGKSGALEDEAVSGRTLGSGNVVASAMDYLIGGGNEDDGEGTTTTATKMSMLQRMMENAAINGEQAATGQQQQQQQRRPRSPSPPPSRSVFPGGIAKSHPKTYSRRHII
jgi:hypothetical protein